MKKLFKFIFPAAVLIIAVILYQYRTPQKVPRLVVQKSLKLFKAEIITHLPSKYEATQIEDLIDHAMENLASHTYDDKKLRVLQHHLRKILNDNKLDTLEVKILLEKLRDFVATEMN
ncbi:MAG: hypothetical protein ACE5HS_10220 [bacterium]